MRLWKPTHISGKGRVQKQWGRSRTSWYEKKLILELSVCLNMGRGKRWELLTTSARLLGYATAKCTECRPHLVKHIDTGPIWRQCPSHFMVVVVVPCYFFHQPGKSYVSSPNTSSIVTGSKSMLSAQMLQHKVQHPGQFDKMQIFDWDKLKTLSLSGQLCFRIAERWSWQQL